MTLYPILIIVLALLSALSGWGALVLGSTLLGVVSALLVTGLVVLGFLQLSQSSTPHKKEEKKTPPGRREQLLDALDDAAIIYDKEFMVQYTNKAGLALFGVTTLQDIKITPRLAQEDSRFERLVQIIYPSLAPVVVPRKNPHSTAEIVDISFEDPVFDVRVLTLGLPEGGFLKIIHDRTRELGIIRSKGEFVTVASHQLRTPLTEISWALETLSGSPTIGEDDRGLITETLQSIKSLTTTTEELLGVAKIEEGRFGYRFEKENIVSVLDELLGKAQPLIENTGLKLFFDRPDEELPTTYIDKIKIGMVINNLLENAVRYNVTNGEIIVKVEQAPQEPFVRVSVKDTGIGIDQGDTGKLFSKFFRAENATRAVAGGTGLGLYIAKNIVRAHGGQIGVMSEKGRGSTFYFTLATDERRVPKVEVATI